jgi:hypothetical protein
MRPPQGIQRTENTMCVIQFKHRGGCTWQLYGHSSRSNRQRLPGAAHGLR